MNTEKLYTEYPDLRTNIVLAYRGSIAHGMYLPGTDPNSVDDKDFIAVCVPGDEYYFGLKNFHSNGTYECGEGEIDIVAYEARKFFTLLAGGNPNVLSLLWIESKYILRATPAWGVVQSYRHEFASKGCYYSFVGYAKGQFHRMTRGEFHGHMGERRKALFDKYGYDCKNAAHLIRLLRMGAEFLLSGEMQVDRGGIDATELLEIKRGEWTLERVNKEAEKAFDRIERTLEVSTLRKEIDREFVSRLCASVVGNALGIA